MLKSVGKEVLCPVVIKVKKIKRLQIADFICFNADFQVKSKCILLLTIIFDLFFSVIKKAALH
jgi:hypothetical protein